MHIPIRVGEEGGALAPRHGLGGFDGEGAFVEQFFIRSIDFLWCVDGKGKLETVTFGRLGKTRVVRGLGHDLVGGDGKSNTGVLELDVVFHFELDRKIQNIAIKREHVVEP